MLLQCWWFSYWISFVLLELSMFLLICLVFFLIVLGRIFLWSCKISLSFIKDSYILATKVRLLIETGAHHWTTAEIRRFRKSHQADDWRTRQKRKRQQSKSGLMFILKIKMNRFCFNVNHLLAVQSCWDYLFMIVAS